MKVYKKPRKSIVEVVDDAGKSVLRYRGHDRKLRYVASSDSPEGGGGGAEAPLVEVTHAELKAMRDGGKLTAGALYRITDYNCTTTQENTQSAGHQFDIVLLALSANKLAEEGWAMMHDNIYDVTFDDGVTKKCWIYDNGNNPMAKYNIVDAVTLKGLVISMHTIEIDEEHKTAVVDSYHSDDLEDEGLTYDYFQNSNLSAWKVWYCLDNDKSRFAWADDSVDETILACITISNKNYYRNKSGDVLGANFPYAWTSSDNVTKYTALEEPESGRIAISDNPNGLPASVNITFTPGHEGTNLPNGRGVIYRLVDEWNNDVGCDFKNIIIAFDKNNKYILSSQDDTTDNSITGYVRNIKITNITNIGNRQQIPEGYLTFIPEASYQNTIVNGVYLDNSGELDAIESFTIYGYTII